MPLSNPYNRLYTRRSQILGTTSSGLDIDGLSDIGEALADADLLIIDNGGDGSDNVKFAASRIPTYVFSGISGDIAIASNGAATIQANSVALSTDTTGNYVATIAGTSNEVTVSGSGSEGAGVTIGLPDDVTIAGDLTVSGTTTTIESTTITVDDPMFALADNNSGDAVDIGWYGKYVDSGTKYSGLVRDASDTDMWKLFATTGNSHEAPSTTVNTTSGFTLGNLSVNELTGTIATAAQTNITSLGTLTGLTLDGDKSVTPGDGAMIHVDTSTITDSNTSGSGTAAKYAHVTLEAPTLAATNSSVTTTDAATLYINAAATAGSNQTITRNWGLWLDAGNARFDGSIYSGTTEALSSAGLVTVANQSNITGVGTITSGVWQGTDVGVSHGGTGASTATAGFDALSPMTAEGDVLYGGTSGTITKLAKGSDGEFLKLASGVPSWAAAATGAVTALNSATENEIVTVGSTTTELDAESTLTFSSNKLIPTASAHNAAGTALTMSSGATTAGTTNNIAGGALTLQGGQGKGSGVGGAIIFQTANAGGSGSSLNALATALTINQDLSVTTAGTIELGHASDTTIARASSGEITIEGNAVYRAGGTDVAIADGGTGAGSKSAGFDALSPMSAEGDVLYGGSSGTGTRLAKGSDGEFLKLSSGVPIWGSVPGAVATGLAATSSSASEPVLTVTNTHADATAGYLKFIKDPGSGQGADADILGTITFFGTDASNNAPEELARMESSIVEADHGSEAGAIKFYVAENDATMTAGLQILGQATDDGEIDVTIGAGAASTTTMAGTLTMGTTAAMTNAGLLSVANQSGITGLGTISSGTWEATDVAVAHGGTGASSLTANAVLTGNGTSAIQAETDLLFSSNKLIPTASAHNAAGTTLTMSAGTTTAGTTDNIAGGALTFQGGQGKGSGAGGDIIFQTANAGGSGSSLNSLATALTISDDLSATFGGNVVVPTGATVGPVGDTDLVTLTASGNIVTVAGELSATTLDIGGTNISSTAGELNLLDGSAKSTSSITIGDTDAFVVIDGTTTKQIPASDIKTYASGDSATKGFAIAMAVAL